MPTLETKQQNEKEYSLKLKETPEHTAACFDLQQVLQCPYGNISQFYYSRKAAVYNLSIYCLGSGLGTCYMWCQTTAGRGACEVASCIFHFIQEKIEQGAKHLFLTLDNCGGQNRNKFVASMYVLCPAQKVTETGTSDQNFTITHCFLEKGLLNLLKKQQEYTPEQYFAIAGSA